MSEGLGISRYHTVHIGLSMKTHFLLLGGLIYPPHYCSNQALAISSTGLTTALTPNPGIRVCRSRAGGGVGVGDGTFLEGVVFDLTCDPIHSNGPNSHGNSWETIGRGREWTMGGVKG